MDFFNSPASKFADLQSAFGKYIVSPIIQFGLGGFIFDVEGETQVSLTADITDHFTEGNFSVQDHIALKPLKIKLDTYVGELVYRGNNSNDVPLQNLSRKLVTINSYLSPLSDAGSQAKSVFDSNGKGLTFENALNDSLNLYGMAKNILPPTTKQQQAYQYFKALYESKILMSLQTPFEFISNLAIESITATQDEDSKYISNFGITLKQIRVVSEKTLSLSSYIRISDGRTNMQNSIEYDKGFTQGIDYDANILQDGGF